MSVYNSIRIFYILCLGIVFKTPAQNAIYELQSINVKEGLPNSSTHDILQDQNNFIWISTPGSLLRYDGYNFKNFDASFFNIDESATLSMALDKNNLIWFCERLAFLESPKSGVLNPETSAITTFEDFTKGLFKSSDVVSLNASQTEEGVIFIFTKNGMVYKYDGDFRVIFSFSNSKSRILRVVCDSDRSGNYWIAHNDGDILKVNNEKQVIENYKIDVRYFIIRKIISTESNVIFEGYDSKLKKDYWELKDKVLKRITRSLKGNFQLLNAHNPEVFFFQNDSIYKQQITDFSTKNNTKAIASIPNLQYNSSFIDKQGILWITSSTGIYKLVSKPNPFTIYESKNSIRGVFVEDSTLWIGGYKQNITYNLKTKKTYSFKFQNNTAIGITKDKTGHIWIGTNVNKLYKYDSDYNIEKSFTNNTIKAFQLPYQNPITNRIWLGMSSGLSYLDDKDELINYQFSEALDNAQIRQFLYTTEGIWIVSNRGLFLMDATTDTITKHYSTSNILPTDNINHIYKDADGIFWLASKTEGLIRWHINNTSFKRFTAQDGLSNNTIYAVYEDNFQHLWLPSNYGLMRFDKVSNDVQVFTIEDGIADNEFNTFSHFKATNGQLFFGSINGLTSFHPKDFINQTSEENPIYLSDISILTKDAEEFKSLALKYKGIVPIPLNYDDQILQFELSLLDFKYLGSHQYAYKIDGYHKQWIYTRDHKISIFNFPYGAHNIRIKAKGDSDRWTTNELVIPITVNKPFYLKWQYISTAVLALILILYLYLKWRIKNLSKAKLKLESEVKNRTQQIENDKEIIELQAEELKALDVAKGRFFANLTHEFRTPLTLIIGPLEQIIDNPPPGAILKRRASGILSNAKHILGLINQLLDLTKLESKEMPLEVVNTDIVAHTSELIKRFQPLALQHEQHLYFTSNETEWFTNFDNDKWDKIIYNLLSNAIKFTPKQGEIAVIVNRLKNEETDYIELCVKDSGMGIADSDQSSIFNRFYQADLSAITANKGTGIGLALVKELVDLQKGDITVSSKTNEGATFRITLPVLKSNKNKSYIPNQQNDYLIPVIKQTEDASLVITENDEKLDILVIDDNEEIRDYIVQCLGQHDYNISTSKDGEEGLQKALSLIPDLIISDVMMPKKNGFELVEDLRNHISTSHIPIILLTAKATQESKIQGLKRGADAYLTKPFNPKELDIRVKNLIEIRMRLQERYAQKDAGSRTDAFEQEDAFILELRSYIIANLSETDLNGDIIGQHFGLSRIHLYRKLKALTKVSISEFVKDIRLEKGFELINQNQLNISEIAYDIGFTSPSHFSRSFKEKYGKSPSQM